VPAYPAYPRAASEENDTRVQCPTCGRKFSDVAAERHIPKCGDIRAKPKMLRAGGGGMSNSLRKGPGGTGRF
jgi:predicted nucleic-acid-binding Zn-ribbon protein